MTKTSVLISFISCLFLLSCAKEETFEMSSPEDIDAYRSINADRANTQKVLLKDTLRILDIGNSYTSGIISMIPAIFENLSVKGENMCYYSLVRGGSTFKSWYDCYYDNDNDFYTYYKLVGTLSSGVKEGMYEAHDGSAFREILNEKWDLILIHQCSQYATNYDLWFTMSRYGYLPQFTLLLHSLLPQASFGTYVVHSYASKYAKNTERSSRRRYANILRAVQRMTAEAPAFQVVVPYGTAIQNLRAICYDANGKDMTCDGTHLGMGLPRYTASLCLFETLFSRRYAVSVKDCTLRYTCTPEEHEQFPDGCTDVTDINAPLAISAAINACSGQWTEY